jgi:hypothetical protein
VSRDRRLRATVVAVADASLSEQEAVSLIWRRHPSSSSLGR